MADYREPVKITIDKEIALTTADLNKTLIVTDDKNADFAYYTSLEEVKTAFGDNSKVYKAVEVFLSQTDGNGNILKPDFFSIVGVAKEEAEQDTTYVPKVKEAINEVLKESWYCLVTLVDSAKLIEELRAVIVSERKVYIAETATYPLENADKAKSERTLLIYNTLGGPEKREYKAAAYAGSVITPGAGSKCSLVKLSGVTADVSGGKKQELTKNNITFVEKRTSQNYIVANGGMTMEGTYLDETTTLDCIIVNLNEAIEKMLILKGFPQDSEGYTRMEETITSIMEQMGDKNLIAKENGIYEYKVTPVTQTKEERMSRIMKPEVIFRPRGWAYFVDLTLKMTYDTVNKSN